MSSGFDLDLKNKEALKYSTEVSDRIFEICNPLYRSTSITHFSYMEIFPDGQRLFLCPNKEWLTLYVENGLQDSIKHPRHRPVTPGVSYGLWSSYYLDDVFSALQSINIWNGFTIFDRQSESLKCYHFASHKDNSESANFYLNNMDFLSKFIFYFSDQVADITDASDSLPLIKSKRVADEFNNKKVKQQPGGQHAASSLFEPRHFTIDFEGRKVSFTPKEAECITHIFKGSTVNEIASQMNISPRTAEKYTEVIKRKLGLTSKYQISASLTKSLFELISKNSL